MKKNLNDLSQKATLISTKDLTKNLANKYNILNGTKYFSSDGLQIYLVFISINKYLPFFSSTTKNFS